ncbi:MAG: peptidase, partial [Caulobacteraceae bacterium]|nr:peptidase [Caulobacteraceae bacterium]
MRGLMLGAVAALWVLASAADAARPEFGGIGLDTGAMDRGVKPGDDFFAYTNGGWVKAAQIPADRSSWGDVARLREQSLTRVRELLEQGASRPGSAEARKYGDLYASYMDEAAVQARGGAPLKPVLDQIAAIQTPADLARTMAQLQRVQPPFGFGGAQPSFPVHAAVDVNLKDPTTYVADLFQGGLGAPDREYYLSSDPKLVAARGAYRTYL